ncbi:MAG: TRAP transporter small permease subunit [Rhodobacteraceae bacterium]|nr:TRAP transporter small permease subunit [Paracoccaceae bacterium]
MSFFHALHSAQRAIAGLLLIAMTVIYGANVLIRVVAPDVSSEFAWVEETVSFMMIWCSFLAASVALLEGRHVSVDMLKDNLPPALLTLVKIAINATGAVVCGYLAWQSWNLTNFVLNSGQISPVMGVSMAVLYLPALVGMALLCLGFLLRLWAGDAPFARTLDRGAE